MAGSRNRIAVACGLLLAALSPSRANAAPVIVNQDGPTYDSHPSAVILDDGSTWIAWHAYHHSRDRVLARVIPPDGAPGPLHEVSDPGTAINGPPELVAHDDHIWVVWPASTGENRWQILARQCTSKTIAWQPIESVSTSSERAITPAALLHEDGTLTIAWSGHRDTTFRIQCRQRHSDGTWSAPIDVSTDSVNAYRPVLETDHEGTVRVFWDQYDDTTHRYAVKSRALYPERTPIENVSPPGADCLTPTALATNRGLFAAWLHKSDVMGGPGVVSQLHTLQAARRKADGTWILVVAPDGTATAAELTHGLMAKVEPGVLATGGYLGRRAAPMLLDDKEDKTVWLLWERKANHSDSTPNALGDLLARPIDADGRWGEKVQLHTGRVDYHLLHPAVANAGGTFTGLASPLPRDRRRLYELTEFELRATAPFEQSAWTGWEPVALPIAGEQPERHEITIDNTRYRLFWGDFHCHTGLTADAEGQPDEMTCYARDRARLDVVAFTNNDFIYDVPLTEYEYALSSLFAHVASRPGEFISLPGYEWTSRIPGVESAAVGDPGNWTSPYQNKSYPNHRSVVYPPSGGPLIHFPEVGNDIAVLNAAVLKAGGITLTQHDAFKASGHPVEVAMELTSGWGNYINRRPDLFHKPLQGGTRIGFVACGDTHRRAPGLSGALTGIYATELTADAILDALRNRRCFATAGSKILVDSRANGTFMGTDTTAPERQATIALRAIGTRPIQSATLIRDGEAIATFEGDGNKEVTFTHVDRGLPTGTHWYYWEVHQDRPAPLRLPGNTAAAHGHLAWSSPNWVIVP